ncbi:hypothetical protein VPH35_087124 [Triticum aestivum]|uniref:F-box domain-containing protein n=1 Tax=Triticum turgidum subsp. durum TaxID=4567 RepID=A0A9R0WW52_TRITD|nr:unnamed protein product [Triticum turgidum subsp. durum]
MLTDMMHHGREPHEINEILALLLYCIHRTLPDPPVSAVARLSALPSDDPIDRVSRLPDVILRRIVSLLPIKDAARTALLSRCWRGVWRSISLVLTDTDLSPSPAASALSRVLEAHPGPFRASTSPAATRRSPATCSRPGSSSSPPRGYRSSSSSTAKEEIFVVNAPRLQRLINLEGWTPDTGCTKVRIGHAPKLQLLAYLQLDTGNHVFNVGNTIIKAGTRVSPRTMVPSVIVLALEVRFDVRNDAKMIPSVLGCFRNVETLHIKCGKSDQSTGKLNLKSWHDSGTAECIQSCIKELIFHDFRGGRSELAFLKYFVESASVLKQVLLLLSAGCTV